ncbi:MAG: ATP-binding cassette domain-containing protein [Candidatus Methanosuratincola sp.]
MEPILTVANLKVNYRVPGGIIRAVDGVSFSLYPGKTLAVVGESGCGKTTLAKAILGLEPIAEGEIYLQGKTHAQATDKKRIHPNLSGIARHIGIVWQDPYASLDPRWKIGDSIAEPLRLYRVKNVKERVQKIMEQVGLDPALKNRYPHELSGGQRQRVAIARALVLNPPIVLCDEPTAALDLSIRAQILNLLCDLQKNLGCAYLYISHDLTTVQFIAHEVAVMYLGRFVETGSTHEVFQQPRHPYTRALCDSAPSLNKLKTLPPVLPGEMPDPRIRIQGCRFKTRCPRKSDICETVDPPLSPQENRAFACHFPLSPDAPSPEPSPKH